MTIVYSVLVALLIAGTVLFLPAAAPLDHLERPDESLERLVTREMDLRDALRRAPRWERVLAYVVHSPDESALKDSIAWDDELTSAVELPLADLYRVILLGEVTTSWRQCCVWLLRL